MKTAAVAMKDPMKFGSLAHTFSNVLLYRSDQVTAMGSAIRFGLAIIVALCRRRVPTGPPSWNKERLKDNWSFYIKLRFVKVCLFICGRFDSEMQMMLNFGSHRSS